MKPTYEELEQQLAESHRALRAETTSHDNVKNQLEKMAAENAGLKSVVSEINNELYGQGFQVSGWHLNGDLEPLDSWFEENNWNPETPSTDACLAEIKTAIEYPKNNSSSNGWTIDPEFLSRVEERAGAVYGYYPGLEETEAALLAGMDLLRERAAQ